MPTAHHPGHDDVLERIAKRLDDGDDRMARIEALLIGDLKDQPGYGERLRRLEAERATRRWAYAILCAVLLTDVGTRVLAWYHAAPLMH